MRTVPSDNILKLRKLADEICTSEMSDEYRDVVFELKSVLDEGTTEIAKNKTIKNKVKCYEAMCITFTKILNKIK